MPGRASLLLAAPELTNLGMVQVDVFSGNR